MRNFLTVNEFHSFVDIGYRGIDTVVEGKPVRIEFAPGLRLQRPLNQVRHHAVLAHGIAVQAIRAMGRAGTRIGPAENINVAVPAIETPENIRAAETRPRDERALSVPILEGKYSDDYLAAAGKDAPVFTDEDLRIISSPLDFVGLNVYRPCDYVVAAGPGTGVFGCFRRMRHIRGWHRLACAGARGDVLGAPVAAVDLESEGNLHHREWLRGERRDRRSTARSPIPTASCICAIR